MKHKLILTALLATSALTLTTLAQDADRGLRPGHPPGGPGGPGGPGRGFRPPPLVAVLDANKDGKIDATELANAGTAIATLDKNTDGQITLDELMPARRGDAPEPPADAPKRPTPPLLEALDVDKDGLLSAREVGAAAASLARLDKNTDGVLTPDEFMGERRGDDRGPRGPRGPGGPSGPGRGPRPDTTNE